jgi:hypothetical protein
MSALRPVFVERPVGLLGRAMKFRLLEHALISRL